MRSPETKDNHLLAVTRISDTLSHGSVLYTKWERWLLPRLD